MKRKITLQEYRKLVFNGFYTDGYYHIASCWMQLSDEEVRRQYDNEIRIFEGGGLRFPSGYVLKHEGSVLIELV